MSPYPALPLPIVEQEIFVQCPYSISPGGLYIGIERPDHQTVAILDHAVGCREVQRKILQNQPGLKRAVVIYANREQPEARMTIRPETSFLTW